MRAFTIKASDVHRCPAHRLDPDHYRDDGSCLCGSWDDELLDELTALDDEQAVPAPPPPPPPAPPARFESGTGRYSFGGLRYDLFGRRLSWF